MFGKPKKFAPRQYNLLRTLVEAGGKVVTRKELLDRIYEHDSDDLNVDTRAIDQGICQIRKRIGKASKCLVTVTQRGYRWVSK